MGKRLKAVMILPLKWDHHFSKVKAAVMLQKKEPLILLVIPDFKAWPGMQIPQMKISCIPNMREAVWKVCGRVFFLQQFAGQFFGEMSNFLI